MKAQKQPKPMKITLTTQNVEGIRNGDFDPKVVKLPVSLITSGAGVTMMLPPDDNGNVMSISFSLAKLMKAMMGDAVVMVGNPKVDNAIIGDAPAPQEQEAA